jgi:hypothetical protein
MAENLAFPLNMDAKDIKDCITFLANKQKRTQFEIYIVDDEFPCNPDDETACKLVLKTTLPDNITASFYANPALEKAIQSKMKFEDS